MFPSTPMAVEWDRVSRDPKLYEDMVSCLLCTLHPDAIRTDGSGGDGGKDVHLHTPGGLEIFELKSWVGRPRRPQVERSFARAMTHSPAKWTVVAPIDLTDAERNWFDRLTSNVAADCSWYGLTQLNRDMAENPAIVRYWLQDVDAELRRLVELYHAEAAALSGGAPEAANRIAKVAAQLAELDPFYRVDMQLDTAKGLTRYTLQPKYRGATYARPIRFAATIAMPDTEQGRAVLGALRASIDYGEPSTVPASFVTSVEVDAPLGLGARIENAELRIEGSILQGTKTEVVATLKSPSGRPLGRLPLAGGVRIGVRGVSLDLTDESGCLHLRLRGDHDGAGHQTYTYTYKPTAPVSALPAMRFLSHLKRPNILMIFGGPMFTTVIGPPTEVPSPEGLVEPYGLELMELLGRVQEATHFRFPVPAELTDEEVRGARQADELLQGKVVTATWSGLTVHVPAPEAETFLQQFNLSAGSLDRAASIWLGEELEVPIGRHLIPVGPTTTCAGSARLADPAALRQAVTRATCEETICIDLVPGNTNGLERWVGAPEERPGTST